MYDSKTTRRRFIVAAITFSGITLGTFGPPVLRLGKVWAQSGGDLDQDTLNAMVRMARRLYPHDTISDEVYAEVLDQAMSSTAADESFASVLGAAEEALNAQQPGNFTELDEAGQIAAMKSVEGMDFFDQIRGAVSFGLYNHPAVWQLLGYEGPSYEKGGYLHRGAGDIDWLPEVL